MWKARDPRLNRDVSIKSSRIGFSGRFAGPVRTTNEIPLEFAAGEQLVGNEVPDNKLMADAAVMMARVVATQFLPPLRESPRIYSRSMKSSTERFASRRMPRSSGSLIVLPA